MNPAATRKPRPKYLSLSALLFEIRLPLPAWVSILHRVSGALLFFPGVLWLLFLLDRSLSSPQGFDAVRGYLAMWPSKLAVTGFLWLFCHHFFAGIRYLALDLHKGIDKVSATRSGIAVLVAGALTTLWLGSKVW